MDGEKSKITLIIIIIMVLLLLNGIAENLIIGEDQWCQLIHVAEYTWWDKLSCCCEYGWCVAVGKKVKSIIWRDHILLSGDFYTLLALGKFSSLERICERWKFTLMISLELKYWNIYDKDKL